MMPDKSKSALGTPHFDTSDVEANLAIEQGLGVGARELAAQRDPGGILIPDDESEEESSQADVSAAKDDEQLAHTSDA